MQSSLNPTIHLLAIESATEHCSVSLLKNGEILISQVDNGANNHSEVLSTMIEQCLRDCDLPCKALSAIAISNGPGSYTGLRVGAATAKGLCYSLNIPLIPISTLEAIALPFRHQGFPIMATIDARRMEVYAQLFDLPDNSLHDPTTYIWEEDLINNLSQRLPTLLICGNGGAKAIDACLIPDGWKIVNSTCNSSAIALLGYQKFLDQNFVSTAYHVPFYFKAPNITKSIKHPLLSR